MRYYDLRLRYSSSISQRAPAEQDLGRGFGYRISRDNLPIIAVGTACADQFKGKRGGRKGILHIDADRMMQSSETNKDLRYPKKGEEFDIRCYRKYWTATATRTASRTKGHFDAGGHSKGPFATDGLGQSTGWTNNPRRFLLFGRPQIGKTGAFLHLALLFQQAIGDDEETRAQVRKAVEVDPIPPEPVALEPDHSTLQPPSDHTYDAFPHPDTVRELSFSGRKTLVAGKYGLPGNDEVWEHYTKDPKQSSVPEAAAAGSTAGATSREVPTSAKVVAGPIMAMSSSQRAPDPKPTADYLAKGPVAESERKMEPSTPFKFGLMRGELELNVPDSERKWWTDPEQPDTPPKMSASLIAGIEFPIFTPSVGRSDVGLLDLSDAIPTSTYLHVVVVKIQEADEYRKRWPNKTLLVLPASATGKGVGASRYWIQRFAEVACRNAFPYCFVLDDSVQYWKGAHFPTICSLSRAWALPAVQPFPAESGMGTAG